MNKLIFACVLLSSSVFATGNDFYISSLAGKIFSNIATYEFFKFSPGQTQSCTQIDLGSQTRYICSVINGSAQIGAQGQVGQGNLYFNQVTASIITNSDGSLTRTYQFNGSYLESASALPLHSAVQMILTGKSDATGSVPSYQGSLTFLNYGIVNGIEAQ